MHTLKTTTIVSAALISLLLSACGGDGSQVANQGGQSSNSSSVSSGSTSSSGVVNTTDPKAIGFGSGSSFIEGAIGVGVGDGTLAAGGQTTLTVNIVSETNTLVTQDMTVTFNSVCVAAGEAQLTTQLGESARSITTTGGEATIVYTAKGCVGPDLVTATVTLADSTKSAQTTLNVAPGVVGSIKFVDATPILIGIAGTGNQETSTVRFQVLSNSSTQDPIKNVDVNFSLNTVVGGISLSTATAKTDRQGYATTTVKSGTIHTSVRVTASAETGNGPTTTQSDKLVISTGIPDQDSYSLAATVTHPVAWEIQGVESIITARLGDAFNNPPPEGTTVAFTTEGGQIDDSCQTNANGACSATWRSQNPNILRNSSDYSTNRLLCVDDTGTPLPDAEYEVCRRERAGRITLLATTIGNESYIDENGTGLYESSSDIFTNKDNPDHTNECEASAPLSTSQTQPNSAAVSCDDLGEAYLDKNENGKRETNEEYTDFSNNNTYDLGNNIYNGILCSSTAETGGQCTKEQITIRQEMRLVVTSYNLLIDSVTGKLPFIDDNISVPYNRSGSTWFWMADKNGNGVPVGTTLSLDTAGLKDGTANIFPKGPLPASDDPTTVTVTVTAATDKTPSGSIIIKITRSAPAPIGSITTEHSVDVNGI
jgi:hypothetical protein